MKLEVATNAPTNNNPPAAVLLKGGWLRGDEMKMKNRPPPSKTPKPSAPRVPSQNPVNSVESNRSREYSHQTPPGVSYGHLR